MIRYNSFFAVVLVCALSADARAVTMSWSPVGNPGNANDPATGNGNLFGGVSYNYNIGTYDVTNNQYVEFLNAKDPNGTSPLQLYNSHMSSASFGGISFNNLNPAGSMYGVISGDGNHPVNYETWYSAIRFANWLNNGQGSGDTETGAYTLLGGMAFPVNGYRITRNAGATVFLPSENEWYKAAYNNPGGSTYNLYPTSSSLTPTASGPTATPNSANYNNAVGNLTDVGAYSGTTSPYGAFDMGGNVFQWNETLLSLAFREVRGGSFDSPNTSSSSAGFTAPTTEHSNIGFRLVNIPGGFIVPEPSTFVLAAFGFIGLAAWGWRRLKR